MKCCQLEGGPQDQAVSRRAAACMLEAFAAVYSNMLSVIPKVQPPPTASLKLTDCFCIISQLFERSAHSTCWRRGIPSQLIRVLDNSPQNSTIDSQAA